ncbi:hypothetical protein [Mitsuaria sp. 7]|uniref:hypothetical protein n=1 Tax=Mitsuaria sp. 7 TaxID=1658665 RepID=UPI0007DD1DB8|nr:hypothetical protein [Mitsuaria sp. 7]ANH66464.1 hypothetical protein ABE85_00825 [Mitsuaria sp. 7]
MSTDTALHALLTALFMLGVGAPFLISACRPQPRPARALRVGLGVLVMAASLASDPLSVALLHVDGVMAMAGCGS